MKKYPKMAAHTSGRTTPWQYALEADSEDDNLAYRALKITIHL